TLIFAASYNGLLKSSDGGRTWASANTVKQVVAPAEPARKEPVKAKGRHAAPTKAPPVAKRTAQVTEVPIPFAGAKIYTLRTVMDAKPWLFAGTSMGLFASDDNGETWQAVPITADQVWPIYRIILPAHGLHKMVAMTSGGPFFSDDRGRSWR